MVNLFVKCLLSFFKIFCGSFLIVVRHSFAKIEGVLIYAIFLTVKIM